MRTPYGTTTLQCVFTTNIGQNAADSISLDNMKGVWQGRRLAEVASYTNFTKD